MTPFPIDGSDLARPPRSWTPSIVFAVLALPGLVLAGLGIANPERAAANPDAAVLAAVFGSFGILLLLQARVSRPRSTSTTLPWWVFGIFCVGYVALEAFAISRWRDFIDASHQASQYQGSREPIIALVLPAILAIVSALFAFVLRKPTAPKS